MVPSILKTNSAELKLEQKEKNLAIQAGKN